MIKLMDSESISMPMEQNMRDNEKMIFNMVPVLKPGVMDLNMKEVTLWEKNMEEVLFYKC